MASVTSEKAPVNFEVTGIERVPENDRAHTQLRDTMWLWWSANAVVATVALGSIGLGFNLGFWGTVAVILIFNVIGVLPVAFLSTLGPKTGLAQMPLSRFAFGLQGAKLPALFNALACIGWSAVNAVIGSSLIVQWSAGKISLPVALIILAAITTVVSVFGYFIVHRYERFAWIPMLVLFGYVFFAASSHFTTNVPIDPKGLGLFAGIASFGGAVFGYAVGWSSYAADYTRRQPVTAPARRVFWYAFIGVAVPCILLEILGVLLTTGVQGDTPGALLGNAIGRNPISYLVILLLAFSTIANNVPNDYSFALSTQVLGIKVKRWILTLVGAVAYLALAFYVQDKFSSKLEGFLLLIAYWLGAWCTIVLIEHWLRRGQYPVQDYETASKLPVGIAALVSMIIGLAVAAVGVNQAFLANYEGPLAKSLGDADIGFPLAILVSGILFFFLRRWELARFKR
jgi:NCS1 nucleoside transporter family